MAKLHSTLKTLISLVFLLSIPPVFADDDPDLWFYVLVKSSNYSQNESGQLTLLNYHFFSEIFSKSEQTEVSASMVRHDAPDEPMLYHDRGETQYIEGGHFDSLEDVDAAFPNGEFTFTIQSDNLDIQKQTLSLAGADGKTEIPAPITIYLHQDGSATPPNQIDSEKPLTISWSEYSNGVADPNGIVDDMIFVVVQDCRGERIVHTGLPFKNTPFYTFRETEVQVDAGKLRPGEPYSMFVEFPHVADSVVVNGVGGFTSFATATYLDLNTLGTPLDDSCLNQMPAMDTGQTDRN